MRNTRCASRGTRTGIFATNRHKSCGLVLYIGRVNTVYCGVDTDLLPDYRDPMLGGNRISSGSPKSTDQKPTRKRGRLMRHHPSKPNIVWTVLFSLLTTLVLNACGDSNNVSGPPAPIPLSPDAKLSSLTVTPGTLQPAFSNDGTNYTVDVSTSVASVTVAAQPQTAGATVNINGQVTTNRSVTLGAAGSSTVVTLIVTAPSGSQNTYIVTVNRAALASDAGLSNLQVSTGTLSPLFAAPGISGLPGYTVTVPNATTSITVTAVKADPNATLTISPSTTVNNLPVGNTVFTIEVTALNGNQKTYFVTVNRLAPLSNNADLSTLEVFAGAAATPPALALTPSPFSSATTSYTTAEVDNTVTQITIVATRADPNATMTIDGVASTGQTTVNIGAPGSTTQILIVVTPPSGPADAKTYTVDVPKAL